MFELIPGLLILLNAVATQIVLLRAHSVFLTLGERVTETDVALSKLL